jgi:hypothetical protein
VKGSAVPILDWQKSSYCGEGDACLHVTAEATGSIRLTESSDPGEAILTTTPATWSILLRALKENGA